MRALLLALAAAILFGASTPISKILLTTFDTFQLAGFLYLGAALMMLPLSSREWRQSDARRLDRINRWRLAGAIALGGIAAPVLMLAGLGIKSAATTSLLLNLEPAATAVLGVLLFRDHLSRRSALGVVGITAGGAMLSWNGGSLDLTGALLVTAACVCWGVDNQLMALIDGMTPSHSTLWKGFVAGSVNLAIGLAVAPLHASTGSIVAALTLGGLSYGLSIAFYLAAAQQLGATRAQGIFATAPFAGAALSVLILGEPLTMGQMIAAAVLVVSVAALVAGQHGHPHHHGSTEHIHSHRHDDGHHLHVHPGLPLSTQHTHRHVHEPLEHLHPHWPDLHHRHSHGS